MTDTLSSSHRSYSCSSSSFILQNTESVKVPSFTAEATMPLGVALVLAAIGGILLAALVGSLGIWELRHRLGKQGNERARIGRSRGSAAPNVGRRRSTPGVRSPIAPPSSSAAATAPTVTRRPRRSGPQELDERGWIDGPVNGVSGDVGEAQVVVAGVAAEPAEGLVDGELTALGDPALGLLDHDSARQRCGELGVDLVCFHGGAVLQDGDGGDVGECLGDQDVVGARSRSRISSGKPLREEPPAQAPRHGT
jgi:Lipopolysaccharide assembly protein A domain